MSHEMLFSAFEGIGTIVAIESSMRSPRKHFPRLIAVAISSVLVILCGFGTACFAYFGPDTKQVITLNLPDGSPLVVALWWFILVSILLTFPLQVFPIFISMEDVWVVEHRILFLLRRAAITASCTGIAHAVCADDSLHAVLSFVQIFCS
jgi:amino acid permease